MEILNLSLTNFRNFAQKSFIFDPKLTVIIGPNGSGKSNILEAIAFLSGIRAHSVDTDLDLVRFGQSEAKIEGRVDGNEPKILTINFQVLDELYVKKAYFIDSIKKRWITFGQFLVIVIFHPRDLELVTGSPSARRHFLDILLSATDREYWRSISAYNKIVVRRNRILQRITDGKSKPGELDFWDSRLLEHGKYISRTREEFFEFLNFVSQDTSNAKVLYPLELKGFMWKLKQSLLSEEKLLKNRERDMAAGMTLSGPHRDDFKFLYGSRDLEFFGSRGEQRMAVLALKLAELEYLAVKRGVRPILALDDIFSELDWEHRQMVLAVVGKQQTIITAAESDSVPQKLLGKARVIKLGQI